MLAASCTADDFGASTPEESASFCCFKGGSSLSSASFLTEALVPPGGSSMAPSEVEEQASSYPVRGGARSSPPMNLWKIEFTVTVLCYL